MFLRYFHTLRYLRPVQISERVLRRYRSVDITSIQDIDRRPVSGSWESSRYNFQRQISENRFRFLNHEGAISSEEDWNNPRNEKLWLYNLHYFDDLNSDFHEENCAWHTKLVDRWIDENLPALGNGWEPYPLSLRIVNWVKWFLNGQESRPSWHDSLALQSKVLSQNLENHILGNHLFANAKALVFAGLFFQGEEAEHWLETGLKIVNRELNEQILSDGGNFERSPMYHSIFLHDLLDLINIADTYNYSELDFNVERWRNVASDMLSWLALMSHPDSEISFFNDAAIGIALNLEKLKDYASRLCIDSANSRVEQSSSLYVISELRDTGYIRIQNRDVVGLLDCAAIGPDYLPGHAHADTLSFELSLFGSRVFVNSGTSCYGEGEERLRQRGTAAHNTVVVNGRNSSEVWSSFRVARRAYPSAPTIEIGDSIKVECSHDGYSRLRPKVTHSRNWEFGFDHLVVRDHLDGAFEEAVAYFHLHPSVEVELAGDELELVSEGNTIKVAVSGGRLRVEDSTWHPEFGLSLSSMKLVITFEANQLETRIDWGSAGK